VDAAIAAAKTIKQQADSGDFKALQQRFETKEAYSYDAFRVASNTNCAPSATRSVQ